MKKHCRMVTAGFLFLSIMLPGCSSVRMTVSQRSILEEKLLVQGLERALSKIDLKPLQDKWVTLEAVGLTKDDMPFAEAYVRMWLIKNGVVVVRDPGESDFSLKVFLDVLAVDSSETLFGTPEFVFLGIPVPAIAFYRNVRNRGRTEVQMYALDQRGEVLAGEFPTGVGVAKYDRYTVMFVITWTSTDLEFNPEGEK